MYRAPLPRTKPESPMPDAVFTGSIEAGGRRIEVAGWRGMVGHNWGAEHAERWVWLHALGFAEAPGAWLDVALGRVRVAGRTTPWIANGAVELDGWRFRLGGLGRIRSTRVDARPGALEAVIGGAAATIRVSVAAPLDQTVAFVYADPAGGRHHALNCSIAEVRLRVERPGRPPVELATAFGGAYELGVRETDHGVPPGASSSLSYMPEVRPAATTSPPTFSTRSSTARASWPACCRPGRPRRACSSACAPTAHASA
jgi:hypothetical protein